jgi:predicted PurR-regulated permease PerM
MAKFNALNDTLTAELNKLIMRFAGRHAHPMSLPFKPEILADKFVSKIPENISSVAHAGLWVVILPFVCYFALAQGKEWMNELFNLTPSEYVENLLGLIAEINATLGGYIRGQLLDAMCVGVMTMFGLWILGFDQAVLMGVLVAILNPVPFLAPLVGGSLTLLAAYFQGMPMSSLIGIFCLFALVRLCDDFIFTPFIVGQSVKLHPVVMVFAILAGVEVGGFLGLVFAVPAAAVIKVILSIIVSNRRENLMLSQNHVVS